jgi:penicillin-binding protein 1C
MGGHVGASTAVPLVQQVAQHLPKGKTYAHARPNTVQNKTICWPTGNTQITSCDVQKHAWVINDQTPTTLMHTPITTFLQANDSKLRVSLGCIENATQVTQTTWPDPLQTWIPKAWQTSSRIPPLDPRCNPNHRAITAKTIRIEGLVNNSRIKAHESTQKRPEITVSVIGGEAQWYWFLDGMLLETKGEKIRFLLPKVGEHQLVVVDQSGQSDRVVFVVENLFKTE